MWRHTIPSSKIVEPVGILLVSTRQLSMISNPQSAELSSAKPIEYSSQQLRGGFIPTIEAITGSTTEKKLVGGAGPGEKSGRCWEFLHTDLVAHLRSLYPTHEQTPQSAATRYRRQLPCRY